MPRGVKNDSTPRTTKPRQTEEQKALASFFKAKDDVASTETKLASAKAHVEAVEAELVQRNKVLTWTTNHPALPDDFDPETATPAVAEPEGDAQTDAADAEAVTGSTEQPAAETQAAAETSSSDADEDDPFAGMS